jgi:arylformamidase
MAGWVRDAKAYRKAHPPKVLHYGTGKRHTIDLFVADPDKLIPDAAIVVFIHGGSWQALDPSWFSHLATGLNAHGISVALPSYDLCPDVTVAEIIVQMRDACRTLAAAAPRLVVSGHSAGGHLAACLLATDWPAYDPALPVDLVQSAFSISGLFDLGPLVPTSINAALKLDEAQARAVSPIMWAAPTHGSLDAVVGSNESAEYLRQSRDIVARWAEAGIATHFDVVPDANHFTAIAPMANPASPMVARLKALALR